MENPPLKPPFSWKISQPALLHRGYPLQPVGLTWNHFRRQEALGSGSSFPLFETSLDTGNQHGGDVSSVCPFETSKHETTWCPKMGVPSVLIHFIIGFSLPSSRATPYEWKHPNILKNRRLALKMACFPKHGLVFLGYQV